jgi:hypothetical protein
MIQSQAVLEQYERYDHDAVPPQMRLWYRVMSLVNRTEPTVGSELTQSKVDQLIAAGVKVTIRGVK